MNEALPVLVEVRRGDLLEAEHRGAVVAADPDARLVARVGDPDFFTSTRSAIKPIQALPLVTSGAADRFGITPRELAVACASHNGEPMHTEAVSTMLARAGLDEADLRCGVHPPFDDAAARNLQRRGLPFSQLHNNCSGKHAGMLISATHRGWPLEDYESVSHPAQQEILSTLMSLGGLEHVPPAAVDGCSAPTYGVKLGQLAVAFARLVSPWSGAQPQGSGDGQSGAAPMNSDLREAAKRIVAAITAHPEMVGGSKGRLDTDLLKAGRGRLICKVGAEAVYAIGILPSERFPKGLGIAIKVADGSYRGLGPAVVETLAQLGVLDESAQSALAAYHRPELRNSRRIAVGEVRPVFTLEGNQIRI